MALPNNAIILEAAFENTVKQFAEDSKKRAAITDIDRYNQWVSTLNGLADVGRFDPELDTAQVMDFTGGSWAPRGYSAMDALIAEQEPEWSTGVWPIPFYTAP